MRASLEFLLGLLDRGKPACISREDFEGPNGPTLRRWQELGFVSRDPWANPAPSCPHCSEGVPYLLGKQYRCNRCRSVVDHHWLLLWRLDERAFFDWLAARLQLRGGIQPINGRLWHLGTWRNGSDTLECFYWRHGALSEVGRRRLAAYRNVLLFYGLIPPDREEPGGAHRVSLLELLGPDGPLTVADLASLLRTRGNVRFDERGVLWVGSRRLGEIPAGSREFFFLACLAERLDQFVAYADLKRGVLARSGSTDAIEEATFCQGLKSRIKKKWILEIDRLITTTNKGDGYRLRGYVEL